MKIMQRWLVAGLLGGVMAVAGAAAAGQAEPPVTGEGRLNSVDAGKRTVNINHGPIAELKWPAMTMDFPVAANVDLKSLQPGKNVRFTLQKDPKVMYQITGITPAP
ncbi:MAG: copper-binding protein [Magnetococcales bacterium]|nr:copper-binding protein [Magnetococcales bacterium]